MLCYICSKSSQSSQDLFFETKNYAIILDKLLQITTTTDNLSILDKLSKSLICSDCKDKLEQVNWIFGQIEQLQCQLNLFKRQIEGDLVKNQRFSTTQNNPFLTHNDGIGVISKPDGKHQLGNGDNDLEAAVKPEPFNFLELDYDDNNGNMDLDVTTPEDLRNYFDDFNLKKCTVVLERPRPTSTLNNQVSVKDKDNFNLYKTKRKKVCTICQYCSKNCKTTRFLKIHTRTHTGEPLERPFQCSHCDKSFSTKNNLKGHVTNVHKIGDDLVKCTMCDYTGDQHSVNRHSIVHTESKSLKCEFCDYSTNREISLQYHKKRKHFGLKRSVLSQPGSSTSLNNPFKDNENDNNDGTKRKRVCTICPFCSKDCKTTRFLKIHTRTHTGEPPEKPFKCPHCDKYYPTKTTLKGHVTNVHKIGDGLVKCTLCDYTGDQPSVKRHSIMHSPSKNLKCEFCNYSTHRKTSLKYHIDHKHLGHKGTFLCQVCSRLLSTESQLQLHIKKFHDKAFTHFCPTCRKGFINEKILEKHLLTHTYREKIFVCDQCPKTYESVASLKHHIWKRHNEANRVRCEICSKLFLEQRTLDYHMKLHKPDDKNLHHCEYCGESYVLKKSLSWHIRARHLSPDKFLHSEFAKRKKFTRRNKVPIVKDTDEK